MDFRRGSSGDIGKVLETLSDNDLEMLGGEPEQNLRGDDICVVCEDDGKPVGYIAGFARSGGENLFYSVELAVSPQYRGKGLGYELGRRLVSCVRKTEASLICWRVEKPNESSKRIVEKLGGKLQGFDGKYLKYYIFSVSVEEGTIEEANEVVASLHGSDVDSVHELGAYDAKSQVLMVAKVGDDVAGFILCNFSGKTMVDGWTREVEVPHWLVSIASKDEYRGMGVASKLLSAAIKRVGFKKGSFIVWNCAGDNKGSAGLAQKFGGVEFPCPWWDGWRSFCISLDDQKPQYFIEKYFAPKEDEDEETVVGEMVAGWFRRNGII